MASTMRTSALLLALSLLTPALAGCPPVRGDDDDDSSVGDDDDSTFADGIALETGWWATVQLQLLSDSCELQEEPGTLTFDVITSSTAAFVADWGVDANMQCSVGSDLGGDVLFACDEVEFSIVDDSDGTTIDGSVDYDGLVQSSTSVNGVVSWIVTCSGLGCAGYDLPTDETCSFSFDATFQHEPEDEPDPIPGDGGDEGDEGQDSGVGG